jgi:hypothetical protein
MTMGNKMDNEPETNERGQIFTVEDDAVVVEHYHFGEDVAYEFAVQVRLDQNGQALMATALDLPDTTTPDVLLNILKDRFRSHQAVRDFADAHDVPYELKRDMRP